MKAGLGLCAVGVLCEKVRLRLAVGGLLNMIRLFSNRDCLGVAAVTGIDSGPLRIVLTTLGSAGTSSGGMPLAE